MPKYEFEKKVDGKKVKVYVQSGTGDFWGVSRPCPWCGFVIEATGYTATNKAANAWFSYLSLHRKRDCKV